MEEVHIEWEGPLTLSEVENRNDPVRDVGVYQIYGPHYAYGAYVLLYIGKTEKQTFAKRIRDHGWHLYERGQEVRVHLGRLVLLPDNDINDVTPLIDRVESLLIYVHGPGYNASKIGDPPKDPELQALHVFNWRNHGVLLPEVSGKRWFSKPPTLAG